MQTSLDELLAKFTSLNLSAKGVSYSYVYIKLLRIYQLQGRNLTTEQQQTAKVALAKIEDKEDVDLSIEDLSFIDSRQNALDYANKIAEEQERVSSLQGTKENLLWSGLQFIGSIVANHYGDKVLDSVDQKAMEFGSQLKQQFADQGIARNETQRNTIEDTFGGEITINKDK